MQAAVKGAAIGGAEIAKDRGSVGKRGGAVQRSADAHSTRYMGVGKEGKMDRSRRGDVGGSYRKRSKAAG